MSADEQWEYRQALNHVFPGWSDDSSPYAIIQGMSTTISIAFGERARHANGGRMPPVRSGWALLPKHVAIDTVREVVPALIGKRLENVQQTLARVQKAGVRTPRRTAS